jgi:hypothetical protein
MLLLTNQLRRSPAKLIGRYAQRMLIENGIEDGIGTGQKKRASYERQRRATRGVLISSFPSFAHFKNCFLLCLLPLPCTIRSHDFSSTDAGKLKYFSGHLRRAVIPVHRTAEP